MRAARQGGGGGGTDWEGGKRGRLLRGKVTVSGESRSRAEPTTRSTNTQTLPSPFLSQHC